MKTKQELEVWMDEQHSKWKGSLIPIVFNEIYATVPAHLHGTALLYAIMQGWVTLNDT
jgi:hypothetical protein